MKIKKMLIGISIFGAGVGTGYFVGKNIMLKRYKENLNELRDYYFAKLEELGVQPSDFNPEDLDEDGDYEDDEEPEQYEETDEDDTMAEYNTKVLRYSGALRVDGETKGRPIIKYNKPPLVLKDWGDLEAEDEEDEDYEDEDEIDTKYEAELEQRAKEFAKIKNQNKESGLPYVIDYDEYMDGPENYERIPLYYYSHDRVLCEDDDSKIDTEEEEDIVGFDYEDVLDMQTTVWVRNDILMGLYEIHRVDASYKVTVEGALETSREREFRILGRRKKAMDDK